PHVPSSADRKPMRTARVAPAILATGVMVLGAALFAQTVSLPSYIRSLTTELSLDTYYVAPSASVESKPRNLVLIYLESIEAAFGEPGFLEEDALAPVREATEGWDELGRLRQYDGGGWPMAGL